MRNKYPANCYICGKLVAKGKGWFERFHGKWNVRHTYCPSQHPNKMNAISMKELDKKLDKILEGENI